MWFLRQATASQEIPLGPFVDSSDGNTAETGLSIANTDIKLQKTGATSESSKSTGSAVHIASGRYYAVLDATDTDTIGPMRVSCHVAGALAVWLDCCVLDEAVYDVLFGTTAPSTLGGTAQTGDAFARLGAPAGLSVSADVAAVKAQTAAIETDTQDVQSRLPAALVSGRIDASVGAMASNTLTAAALAADAASEIAAAIEAALINEGDGNAVLEAIRLKIEESDDDLTAGAIAVAVRDAVLDRVLSGNHDTTGSLGKLIQSITEARLAELDAGNLPASVDDVPTNAEFAARTLAAADYATAAALAATDAVADAIQAKTDNLPASPAAVGSAMTLTSGERDSIAAALLDLANGVETSITVRKALRAMAAVLAGDATGAGTDAEAYKAIGNSGTTRVTPNADEDGNRSAVTLNL